MAKSALFPGSFDPFTLGHSSIVERSLSLFDNVVIGVGINSSKKYLFSVEERINHIASVFADKTDRVSVIAYEGLTVDYCRENDISFIVRGIRNTRDFLFENEIAGMNHSMSSDIETVFLASHPNHAFINSTIVREILKNGGEVSQFIPLGNNLPKVNS